MNNLTPTILAVICTSRSKINNYIKTIVERAIILSVFKGLMRKTPGTAFLSILQEGANFYICFTEFLRTVCSHFIISILKGHNSEKKMLGTCSLNIFLL